MTNKPEDISHIAKEIMSGGITNEHVSTLAKLTAKQIYSQGYQAGEMASKIDTWNAAIEAAANWLDTANRNDTDDAAEIRKLKK
jgi:hypothetical protein